MTKFVLEEEAQQEVPVRLTLERGMGGAVALVGSSEKVKRILLVVSDAGLVRGPGIPPEWGMPVDSKGRVVEVEG